MAHHNTIFSQLMKLVPRHEFEALARKHHHGAKLRKMNRWTQFTHGWPRRLVCLSGVAARCICRTPQ